MTNFKSYPEILMLRFYLKSITMYVKNKQKLIAAILIMLISTIVPGICIVKSIKFDQNCAGYLKQAADANTPEIAISRLDKAISYIEANGLTSGYTSVIYRTEDENIGFWYQNIIACRQELEGCLTSSQLEKTNVLMKVRESLTDNDNGGTTLTIPYGIYYYPNNLLWSVLLLINITAFVLSIYYIIKYYLDD